MECRGGALGQSRRILRHVGTRHRNVLRRNRRRLVRHGRGLGRRVPVQPSGPACPLRRRGAGTRFARPYPENRAPLDRASRPRRATASRTWTAWRSRQVRALSVPCWSGATVGRSLAYGLGVPGIGVHHMEAHLLAPLIGVDDLRPPFAALLVSGGHSQIVRVDGVGRYTMLGESLDDAAGEAFDKTAKMLGLGYPGGPAIARAAESGNPRRFRFPRPMTDRPGLDMSFSGLKTFTLNTVREHSPLDEQDIADIACAFEDAVVETLVIKCRRTVETTGLADFVIAGGGRRESTPARAPRRRTAAHHLCTARTLHRQRRDDRLRGRLATRRRRARRPGDRDTRALAHGRTEGPGRVGGRGRTGSLPSPVAHRTGSTGTRPSKVYAGRLTQPLGPRQRA